VDPIISLQEAKDKLNEKEVVFVDCRFSLQDPEEGRKLYEKEHIPGAVYFDLEKDLSGTVKEKGGRHPLPDIQDFVRKLETSGINNETTVIAYDDQQSAMASRFTWLMFYLGHENTRIMDGGYKAWKNQNYPITDSVSSKDKTNFTYTLHNECVANQREVANKTDNPKVAILDSRSFERYAGWEEPMDAKAGHIPEAKHYFWKNLFQGGYWESPDTLHRYFSELESYNELIVYCGSGVTATPNVMALWRAGYQNVKLYVGSWSDWITNPENRIARVTKSN